MHRSQWVSLKQLIFRTKIMRGLVGVLQGQSVGFFVGAFSGSVNPEVIGLLFYYGFALSTLVPWLARGVRRLHDKNKTGMHLLFGLIPLVGAILLIVWFCSKGDDGPNRFGPAV
jgi:hypothetical protein